MPYKTLAVLAPFFLVGDKGRSTEVEEGKIRHIIHLVFLDFLEVVGHFTWVFYPTFMPFLAAMVAVSLEPLFVVVVRGVVISLVLIPAVLGLVALFPTNATVSFEAT